MILSLKKMLGQKRNKAQKNKKVKQAGAELCQAQDSLG